jgi:transposase
MQRGIRLALESDRPIAHIARDLGIGSEVLRTRVRRAEADAGRRQEILTTQERGEIRRLRKENFELRRANEDTTQCPPRGLPAAGGAAAPPVGGSLA